MKAAVVHQFKDPLAIGTAEARAGQGPIRPPSPAAWAATDGASKRSLGTVSHSRCDRVSGCAWS
jgi:hypothetical protein